VLCSAVAQVKYSILDRGPEQNGTIAKCRDLGVSVIAHSPLEQGVLTSRALEDPAFGGKQAEQV
jgi:aryl-alcohol dehydrogenase-like predicted oxidoreductase